jgi:hypothetical protein
MRKTHFWYACLLTAVVGAASPAFGVSFKCYNQTDLKFRMQVQDRGQWRGCEMEAGYWDCPAKKVTRGTHQVKIDLWVPAVDEKPGQWVTISDAQHGSQTVTRILHIYKNKNDIIVMAWYDEPPLVVPRPKPQYHRDKDKVSSWPLIRSDWNDKDLEKALSEPKKIAETGASYVVVGS